MMMKKCCFCISLRNGALLIGYLHMIGLMLLFVAAVAKLALYINYTQIVVSTSLDLAVIVISFGFNSALLECIQKNRKPEHIRNFLFFNSVMLVLHVVQFTVSSFMLEIATRDIIIFVISVLLTIYFLLVIWSYWSTLKSGNSTSNTQRPTAPYAHQVSAPFPAQVVYTGNTAQVVYAGNPVQVVYSGSPPHAMYSGNQSQAVYSGNSPQVVYSGNSIPVIYTADPAQTVYSGNTPQVVISNNPAQVAYPAYPPPPPYK